MLGLLHSFIKELFKDLLVFNAKIINTEKPPHFFWTKTWPNLSIYIDSGTVASDFDWKVRF